MIRNLASTPLFIALFTVTVTATPSVAGGLFTKFFKRANCSNELKLKSFANSDNTYKYLFEESEIEEENRMSEVLRLIHTAELTDAQRAEQYWGWFSAHYPDLAATTDANYITDVLELTFPIFNSQHAIYNSEVNARAQMRNLFAEAMSSIASKSPKSSFKRSGGIIQHTSEDETSKFANTFKTESSRINRELNEYQKTLASAASWAELSNATNGIIVEMGNRQQLKKLFLAATVGQAILNSRQKLLVLRPKIAQTKLDLEKLQKERLFAIENGKKRLNQAIEVKGQIDEHSSEAFTLSTDMIKTQATIDYLDEISSQLTMNLHLLNTYFETLEGMDRNLETIARMMQQSMDSFSFDRNHAVFKAIVSLKELLDQMI